MSDSGKSFRPYNPDAPLAMPFSLRDWLPEDHLVYLISDVVDALDLSDIHEHYKHEHRGQPPYNPRLMVKLIFYAYAVGIPSSRRIEKKTYEDIAFRVLTVDQHPDHDTICDFRKTHRQSLSLLFVQVLAVCQESGLVKLGHISIDGTKIKANASKHKAMSYGRMLEKEPELEQEVERLLAQAQEEDDKDDARYGKGKNGSEVPDDLKFKQKRLQTIRDARQRLETRVREKAIADGKLDDDATPKQTKGRQPETPHGQPKPKDQENFTDPDSRIMVNGDKAFVQAYNCQAAVEEESQIIVGRGVTNQANDKNQFQPLIEDVKANTSQTPEKASADSGYFSEENITYAETEGIDTYIPPSREKKISTTTLPENHASQALTATQQMRCKLSTQEGRETYAKRKRIVEPVFGQTKFGRGLRQFLLRGLENVALEWDLWCIGHNLLKLWRSGQYVRRVQA